MPNDLFTSTIILTAVRVDHCDAIRLLEEFLQRKDTCVQTAEVTADSDLLACGLDRPSPIGSIAPTHLDRPSPITHQTPPYRPNTDPPRPIIIHQTRQTPRIMAFCVGARFPMARSA